MHETTIILLLIFEIFSRKVTSVSLRDVRSGAGRSFIHCVMWKEGVKATLFTNLVLAQFFETDIQGIVVGC